MTRNARPRRPPGRAAGARAGQIDLVPEYVGSGLGYYDKTAGHRRRRGQPDRAPGAYAKADNLAIGPRDLARRRTPTPRSSARTPPTTLKLTKMSDLAAVQDQLKWGLPPDCDTNPLCKDALESYGIKYPPKQRKALAACDAPIAEALQSKAVDFALAVLDAARHRPVRLRRARGRQEDPAGREHRPRSSATTTSPSWATRTPSRRSSTRCSRSLTTDELTKLGVKVAVDKKSVEDVAKEFLTANALLK